MANQVKLFEGPLSIGFFVHCLTDFGLEPEGIIFFDGIPETGDTAVLSDGKRWTVVSQPNDNSEITMEMR